MGQPIRIAIRLPDSGYMGRTLLGAMRAAHARNWIVSMGENAPDYMLRCGIVGIIGAPYEHPAPQFYADAGLPFVSVLGVPTPGIAGSLHVDHEQVGRVAGEHFLHRGFRHFGFVGHGWPGSARRIGFEEVIGPRARSFSVCPVAYHNTPEEFDAMSAWLRSLPHPVGVFAADDPIGGAITEVCNLAGIRVPSEVSVVSVNDDGVRTLASKPELTSVRIPWERFGSEAVNMLAEIIQRGGAVTPTRPVLIGPTGIAVRGSSDIVVVADPEAATAAAFIQQNAHRTISVSDIADATMIGRRLLERRFKAATGRTLLEHVRQTRLDRAKQMLSDSDLRISDVANACGFGTRAQFHRLFHRENGSTPDEYRKRNQDVTSSKLRTRV